MGSRVRKFVFLRAWVDVMGVSSDCGKGYILRMRSCLTNRGRLYFTKRMVGVGKAAL